VPLRHVDSRIKSGHDDKERQTTSRNAVMTFRRISAIRETM